MSVMRAVAQLGQAYNVSVVDVPIPTILNATDVIVRINATAICGSDLHAYHVDTGSPERTWFFGHEAIGHVTEVGDAVQYLSVGDYVIIPDNLDDGHYTHLPDYHQPNTPTNFGGLEDGGSLPGLQTEYARVPFADNSLIPVPVDAATNFTTLLDYLLVSDIFATAWTGLTWSGFQPGDSVAVFGAGPVGLLATYSAFLRGASKVYLVDQVEERLNLGASIGAIPINFSKSDPVEQILAAEPSGVRRSVDAVGYEAEDAQGRVDSGIVLRNLLNVTGPAGGIGIIGLYNPDNMGFDIGKAFSNRISLTTGVVLPLQVSSELVSLIASGQASPSFIVSSVIDIEDAPEYYSRFSRREETKVVIRF